jgi:hypothetical protein
MMPPLDTLSHPPEIPEEDPIKLEDHPMSFVFWLSGIVVSEQV